MLPSTIGRFKVIKTLGSGNQGTVLLCQDPELQRRVAIKLLDKSVLGDQEMEAAFYREARAMSQIQHPNIVTIYEAGKHQGTPFLVFEYVQGDLLGELIRNQSLTLQQTLEVFHGILEGIARAHAQGIVHRDLKPSNVIVNEERVPKVMDFGIARVLHGGQDRDQQLTGSPRYMAPEYISQGRVAPAVDVFALGLILYEMLIGEPAFNAKRQADILRQILDQSISPPSTKRDDIDESLDGIVMKAVDKEPEHRFVSAEDFLMAMNEHLHYRRELLEGSGDAELRSTVDFLLRRIKRKEDFPALAQTMRSLNALTVASDKDVAELSKVIVKDFALTNKMLKIVNSALYGHFSGKVGTISRAIIVMGMRPIRALAASMIFFEHMHNQSQADQLRSQMSMSLFSAILASEIARSDRADVTNSEEYFLTAMLYRLGKMLAIYYLNEEATEINRLIEEGVPETKAQKSVLGVSYLDLGQAVAKRWNFPVGITGTMLESPEEDINAACAGAEKLWLSACFSNDLAQVAGKGLLHDQDQIARLLKRYGKALGITAEHFRKLVENTKVEFDDLYQKVSTGNRNNSFTLALAGSFNPDGSPTQTISSGDRNASTDQLPQMLVVPLETPTDAEAILTDGLQEVTTIMLNGGNISQVLNEVLEIMYRAIGFNRVILVLKDRSGGRLAGRLGFGQDVDSVTKRFVLPLEYAPDVFHAALRNNVDVYIANAQLEKIRKDLPHWFTKIPSVGSFVVLPLTIRQATIGLIYADHPQPNGFDVSGKRLTLLKALRNQLVLACRS